ncbi:hypothetical protein HGRIS_011054 [Hohenbuehelia grisea]|uniref:tyrosinase n=1 Tax=Hohenbuehelia grisea TaxID=104357 RepID=A0ABR3IYU4_9AGAR
MTTTANPYLITGLSAGGKIYPRREVQELAKNSPEQFTLFILASARVRDPTVTPPGPRFADIAGIHGLPYERWPGDPNASARPVGRDDWQGYCNHGSVLFPLWHRPYVMALEQTIGEAAQAIAEDFATNTPDEADKWRQAALELRLPYWDWTLPSTETEGLPQILKNPKLTLQMPGGKTQQIDNMLENYEFKGGLPDGFGTVVEQNPLAGTAARAFYGDWARTYRWPDSKRTGVVQNYARLDQVLKSQYRGLLRKVTSLFSYPTTGAIKDNIPRIWDQFSNTQPASLGRTFPYVATSVEDPHNLIHLIVGGIGNMGDNSYAGFDPIFFLHHCNVDRILSLWEYVYPDYWLGMGYTTNGRLTKFNQPFGTFAEPDNAPLDETTPLVPFRRADGQYWQAADAHSLLSTARTQKYYTYSPVAGVQVEKPATPAERAQALVAIQNYFGFNVNRVVRSNATMFPMLFAAAPGADHGLRQGHIAVANHRHFVVKASLLEHAFSGSYILEILWNAPDASEPESIGSVAVLGRAEVEGRQACAACRARESAGHRVNGIVAIPTSSVAQLLVADDVNRDDTEDALVIDDIKGHLSARLTWPGGATFAIPVGAAGAAEGTALPAEDPPEVELWSASVSHPDGHENGPFEHYDWKQHSVMFEKWEFVAANAQSV